MDKLKQLLGMCKCGVFVRVNQHRGYYQTVEKYISECQWAPKIDAAVLVKMIETDTVIEIIFHPQTPRSHYAVWHYDLDAALDESLACLQ